MKIIRVKYMFTLLILFILVSCGVKDVEFDKSTWNDRADFFYANRESMVKDLMESHLKNGMTYKDVLNLLGRPENDPHLKSNTISYEIMVDYGWDIDPVEGKTLYVEFSNDSLVIGYKLEHWKH